MKKLFFILAALLLPATMCAQSALHQLESLAGMSIYDVNVPDPGDPVPVDPDPEEESQSQQSTHLKDYTPAQEQETPEEKRRREAIEEMQKREAEIWERNHKEFLRQSEERSKTWRARDERRHRETESYNNFINSNPQVQPVPRFSSIDEHKVLFPEPKSLPELFGNSIRPQKSDAAYKADMIIYSSRHNVPAYFLGRRLDNGRVEWRIFINELGEYSEELNLCGLYDSNFDYRNIKDVRLYGEGRVILVEMYDGSSYVLNPHGSFICHGRNISFPAMSGDALFIECDGALYASNLPTATSEPILRAGHYDYYRNNIIATGHYSDTGQAFYKLYSYGGRAYDYKENSWEKYYSEDATYEYIAPFSNDGEYYVLKPFKGNYFIVSYCGGKLYRGKKKYKSLEAAHAGWSKEQQYIRNLHESNPDKCAQNKD